MVLTFAQLDLDLVAWIAAFNLYVLPPIVAAVLLRARIVGRSGTLDPLLDRERTVRWTGLIHYGMALRAVLMVVPELVGYAQFGGFPSLPIIGVYWPLATAVFHVVIGLGLRRLRPWARWADVALNVVSAAFVILAAVWIWSFGAAVDLALWPELALSRILPFFLLFVMLSPWTGRVFSAEHRAAIADRPRGPRQRVRASAVSLITLAFLVVVAAVVVVNTADWIIRYGSEMMGASGP